MPPPAEPARATPDSTPSIIADPVPAASELTRVIAGILIALVVAKRAFSTTWRSALSARRGARPCLISRSLMIISSAMPISTSANRRCARSPRMARARLAPIWAPRSRDCRGVADRARPRHRLRSRQVRLECHRARRLPGAGERGGARQGGHRHGSRGLPPRPQLGRLAPAHRAVLAYHHSHSRRGRHLRSGQLQ